MAFARSTISIIRDPLFIELLDSSASFPCNLKGSLWLSHLFNETMSLCHFKFPRRKNPASLIGRSIMLNCASEMILWTEKKKKKEKRKRGATISQICFVKGENGGLSYLSDPLYYTFTHFKNSRELQRYYYYLPFHFNRSKIKVFE